MAARLQRQLAALAHQQRFGPFEVIVADNGSTDDIALAVGSCSSRLEPLVVVDASDARGSAGARNIAVRQASGDVLAFCDADDVVHPSWVEHLATVVSRQDCIAAGRLVYLLDGQEPPGDSTWPPGMRIDTYMAHLPFADTCNMAIRRATFERLGGFDVSFSRSCDVDFSWRAQHAGVPLVDATEALVAKFLPHRPSTRWLQWHRWAAAQPQLYRMHRHAGVPPRSIADEWREVVAASVSAAQVLAGREGARWSLGGRTAGVTGRLLGSLRWRTWYP